MKITVSGFPPDTTEEEIREAIEDYGAAVTSVTVDPSEDPSEYLAVIDVDTDETGCKVLVDAINGLVWKDRTLRAQRFLFVK